MYTSKRRTHPISEGAGESGLGYRERLALADRLVEVVFVSLAGDITSSSRVLIGSTLRFFDLDFCSRLAIELMGLSEGNCGMFYNKIISHQHPDYNNNRGAAVRQLHGTFLQRQWKLPLIRPTQTIGQ